MDEWMNWIEMIEIIKLWSHNHHINSYHRWFARCQAVSCTIQHRIDEWLWKITKKNSLVPNIFWPIPTKDSLHFCGGRKTKSLMGRKKTELLHLSRIEWIFYFDISEFFLKNFKNYRANHSYSDIILLLFFIPPRIITFWKIFSPTIENLTA